ncbi:hypothetical protein RRG08_021677 [Elysia crispata]|uniref:Uncharacterized protein n=1 Tax=Elysia crispata TaxID=231223 RepID=A0AAE1DP60_9GAST|nr:hypothetical protein RRG08_021677 [Elysia crispata]
MNEKLRSASADEHIEKAPVQREQEHNLPQTSKKTVRSMFRVTDSLTALGPSFSKYLVNSCWGRSTKSGIVISCCNYSDKKTSKPLKYHGHNISCLRICLEC